MRFGKIKREDWVGSDYCTDSSGCPSERIVLVPARWTFQLPGESAVEAEQRLLAGGPHVVIEEGPATATVDYHRPQG